MKRMWIAISLLSGLLPGVALAQGVSGTYGLGNVNEPLAACGTANCVEDCARSLVNDCHILEFVGAPPTPGDPNSCPVGSAYTEAGCARRGKTQPLSSGLLIQSSRFYNYYPIPGTFTISEDVNGVVTMGVNPDGTPSGHVNNVGLDIDLGFDSFLIPSALRFGQTGTGIHINDAGGNRIEWDNPLLYTIEGCLTCQSSSGDGCGVIGLAPPSPLVEGDPVCDSQVQPSDPHTRDMPDWVSEDGFATWHFPDDGNGSFAGGTESMVADAGDIGTINNGGGWIFFGFKGRECGTKNVSGGDPLIPNLGKPDTNCDGNADWTYGMGGIDEPSCSDNLRWCTGTKTACNFDNDCASGQTCDRLPDRVCQGGTTDGQECFTGGECGPKICGASPFPLCGKGLDCDAKRCVANVAGSGNVLRFRPTVAGQPNTANCTADADCITGGTCQAIHGACAQPDTNQEIRVCSSNAFALSECPFVPADQTDFKAGCAAVTACVPSIPCGQLGARARQCSGTTTICETNSDCTAPATCVALPANVCSIAGTGCTPSPNNCPSGEQCVAVKAGNICTGTTRSCVINGHCPSGTTCDDTATEIFPDAENNYGCFPLVDCIAPKVCTGTAVPCTSGVQCNATNCPTCPAPRSCVLQSPGSCSAGCFLNTIDPNQCNKLDRSIDMRSSALALMRDPEHDHFKLTGTIDIVEDLDAAQTRWCSGGSAIPITPATWMLSPKKLCTSAADCPSGETCVAATPKRWCSGTSTECTTSATCPSGSVCQSVGTVYIPYDDTVRCTGTSTPCTTNADCTLPSVCAGHKLSGYNTNNIIIAFVPTLATTFSITAAGRTRMEGATGYGSPGDVIVWNGPTLPWAIPQDGCNVCLSNTANGCSNIFLTDELIACNTGQLGDPQVRAYPDLISFDKGESWSIRTRNGRPGDPNPAYIEAATESFQSGLEQNAVANRGPTQLFGYLRRECGTMNMPNAGNAQNFKFCSLENEYCDPSGNIAEQCPPTNEQCNQFFGTCIGSNAPCCTSAACDPANGGPGIVQCPVVAQTCSRPAGNPYNPRSGMPDRDCDRKVDPGVFPIPSDPFDAEAFFDGATELPLPPDLVEDVCITYAQPADTDFQGHCRCGDQNRDGEVDVSDLVAINIAIFTPALATVTCDANGDLDCDISDIVYTNAELFSPGTTATCVYNRPGSNP